MTRVLRTRAELRAALADVPRPIGLVPTMGWLHEGHRSLMRRARAEDATTVVTIFVNPRQFDHDADYSRYPRDTEADLAICEAEGVDIVWLPEVEEVYPPGFDTTVSVGAVAEPLEGAARPGHFDGVATVVATLFAARRSGARLLRSEGRPTGDGHPAHGPGPGPADGGHPLPHRARARRPGPVIAQRAPDARGAERGTDPAAGARSGPRGLRRRRA